MAQPHITARTPPIHITPAVLLASRLLASHLRQRDFESAHRLIDKLAQQDRSRGHHLDRFSPVNQLKGLSPSTLAVLASEGYATIGDVLDVSWRKLRQIPEMDDCQIEDLHRALITAGLKRSLHEQWATGRPRTADSATEGPKPTPPY